MQLYVPGEHPEFDDIPPKYEESNTLDLMFCGDIHEHMSNGD